MSTQVPKRVGGSTCDQSEYFLYHESPNASIEMYLRFNQFTKAFLECLQ